MKKNNIASVSGNFDILRFIAIFSVVSAHSNVASSNSDYSIGIANELLHIFGTFGVPLFFFISGYFYINKFNKDFIIRKIKTVIIPWFFVETIVWLYIVLRKGGINFSNWFSFIIGNGHSTYYLTVLMILYVLFSYNRQNIIKISLIILLSIICNYLTYSNLLFQSYNINPYLNFLNWAIYFSIGLLLYQFNLFDKIGNLFSKYLFIATLIFCSFIYYQAQNEISIYYWSKFALINSILFIFISIGISKRMENLNLFKRIGRESFSIYLMHELLVGTVIYVSNLCPNWIFVIIRPIVVIAILHIFIKFVNIILVNNEKFRIFRILLGIRK